MCTNARLAIYFSVFVQYIRRGGALVFGCNSYFVENIW